MALENLLRGLGVLVHHHFAVSRTVVKSTPKGFSDLPKLTRRQERYARAVAAGMSYSEAFRVAGLNAATSGAMSHQIQVLNKTPWVRERIAELRIAADQETVSTIAERMAWLRLIISADQEELSRVVADPCGNCWTDETIAQAYAAHFAPTDFHHEPPPLPDSKKPRPECPHCLGVGNQRVVLTPTDELSPAARALFKGASQDVNGVIKIHTHDQLAAADMLNKLQSAYVTRSLNMNVNASVQPAREATPEEAMKLFAAFGGDP